MVCSLGVRGGAGRGRVEPERVRDLQQQPSPRLGGIV